MWEWLAKGARAIATGQAQKHVGLQSPHMPGMVVHLGRFFYILTGGWITFTWYTAYVNQRTEAGSGPTLVLPGKPIIGSPDRQTKTPLLSALHATLTDNGSQTGIVQGAGNALANVTGSITDSITALGMATGSNFPNPRGAYPGPAGRTDQGVDYAGTGPVRALLPGKVIFAGLWPGWPGTDGIVYETAKGPIYVMEHFQRGINPDTGKPFKVGDTVKQGQPLGIAPGGYPYIETGFANAQGTGPLTPYDGRPDGTPMPGGLLFRKLMGM